MVEARPVIFPRDSRRQLDQLCRAELCTQFFKERLRHFDRSLSHVVGVCENQLLRLRKQLARAVGLQRSNFLRRNPDSSADRRADVNSKGTTHQRRHPHFRQVLEPGVHQRAARQRLLHLSAAPQDPWVMSCDLDGRDDASQLAFRHTVYDSSKQPTQPSLTSGVSPRNACHSVHLSKYLDHNEPTKMRDPR